MNNTGTHFRHQLAGFQSRASNKLSQVYAGSDSSHSRQDHQGQKRFQRRNIAKMLSDQQGPPSLSGHELHNNNSAFSQSHHSQLLTQKTYRRSFSKNSTTRKGNASPYQKRLNNFFSEIPSELQQVDLCLCNTPVCNKQCNQQKSRNRYEQPSSYLATMLKHKTEEMIKEQNRTKIDTRAQNESVPSQLTPQDTLNFQARINTLKHRYKISQQAHETSINLQVHSYLELNHRRSSPRRSSMAVTPKKLWTPQKPLTQDLRKASAVSQNSPIEISNHHVTEPCTQDTFQSETHFDSNGEPDVSHEILLTDVDQQNKSKKMSIKNRVKKFTQLMSYDIKDQFENAHHKLNKMNKLQGNFAMLKDQQKKKKVHKKVTFLESSEVNVEESL